MNPTGRLTVFTRAIGYWNWKCALLSATARSLVYLAAMVRSRSHGGLAVVLVEMVYVTMTAGLYAGLQQKALSFRSRLFGNLTVVLFVPGLSQTLDCFAHRVMQASAPGRATVAVCIFTALSALFHLYVMRRRVRSRPVALHSHRLRLRRVMLIACAGCDFPLLC